VYLAIEEAETVFGEIRDEQEHNESLGHWIGDHRIARLLVRAFSTQKARRDSTEDLLFSVIFSVQRCIGLAIAVVVTADAADKFTAVARCCYSLGTVAHGWKRTVACGKYEKAAQGDPAVERDGDDDGAADTSLDASVEVAVLAPQQRAQSDV
jgi:hypothetical protein